MLETAAKATLGADLVQRVPLHDKAPETYKETSKIEEMLVNTGFLMLLESVLEELYLPSR